METNLHSKIKLLKDLKWNIKRQNIREKMVNSSALTHFILCQIGKLEVEVADRVVSKDELGTFLFNHTDWVFKKL
jgi:hypothetical protein